MNFTEKISRIFEKVDALMPLKPINLARKKFMVLFVEGLIKGRSVQFIEVANHMSTKVKTESNHRRIQDFIANYEMNYEQMLCYCAAFCPSKDRSRWP